MNFEFVPMNLEYAKEIINNWNYEGKYNIYSYVNEKEFLLDKETWGLGRFAVLNEKNDIIGELTIEFFRENSEDEEDEGYVKHEIVKNTLEEKYEMWVGWGLKPELCGIGLGKKFVDACVKFALKEYDYNGEYIRCGVAEFNKRAIKVYERAGFKVFNTSVGEIEKNEYRILSMRKKINME
ncbi:GNAT family N-acetyltransferase [Clostridium senegalense]|uniref:GNAT family N-acetyltransferase n=1 Tax=Clostridium senegalense TaxID=1465809 RepID=UPI0002880A81|nr:GNAT family N-acetyltransferase [Clostridium senegalense]